MQTTPNIQPHTSFTLFLKNIIYKFGLPSSISSDKGSDFASIIVDRIHDYYKVKRIVTSAYHPQSNAVAERGWRWLQTYIHKNSVAYQDIRNLLPLAELAMNTPPNRQLGGFTPFGVYYGWTPSWIP